MSYEPRLIIKYEDLKKIEGELFVEQLSDNTDVERIANFLLDELEDPIKFEDKTFLISKPEFTSFNADATKVKLADLKDNSDITRLKGLRKADFDRMEKYHRSFIYLSKI